ncbi:DnaB-like helicase C-terminal domain-containing protein [Terrisporobacter sp.]|uniref:DnaB-like helicase C-terminal domain-containing protein n=1 Tax=Terrisporobacter sp. TaxID=1965305 RepID=UPI00289FA104|nr:DnaB-like helicase C-terminal domain-containing protein [Terrisporobacter sp.]
MENNEVMVESLVLSCIFQDLSLIDEYPLEAKYFDNPKCKFFYELAEGLSRGYKELNEVTLSTFVSQTKGLKSNYEEFNGWDSIIKVKSLAKISNFEKHIDDLYKQNLIKDLVSKGFNISKTIEIEGQEVKPKSLFNEMSCQEVYEFYEMLLANSSVSTGGNDMEVEDLFYTDEEIRKIEEGEDDTSISYDVTIRWTDENGKERYKRNFKNLNNVTDGIGYDNGIFLLASASGGGKSTTAFQMALAMVESNEKVLFISNEQGSRYFKNMLISYVASTVFNCHTITRRKVKHLDFNDNEREVFRKTNDYVKNKYSDRLKFISVIDFNIDRILKVVKKWRLTYGFQGCVIETFKSSNAEENNTVGELVEGSRKIDKFAKKYQVRFIVPMQLRTSTNMKVSYLTAAEISGSKQVVETCGSIVLFRKILQEELNPENKKLFLKPFKWVMDESDGKYKKKYLEVKDSKSEEEPIIRRRRKRDEIVENESKPNEYIDVSKTYRLAFVEKAREGGDDKKILLLELNGNTGDMHEVCWVDNVYTGQLSY